MNERLLGVRGRSAVLLTALVSACHGGEIGQSGSNAVGDESNASAALDAGSVPCTDTDGDGRCDTDDSECNADGGPLLCRRLAPPCPRGTVPEVRGGCYTDRCVTWDECGDPLPLECRVDSDCPEGQSCVDGHCAICERTPTVSERDRYYERFEGISADNACRTDADCIVSGCSGEVCAAERVATTCELLPYGPEGGCGCVAGTCIWNRETCEPGGCVSEPTVSPDDRYYDRFEGTSANNACRTSADCVVGGCSGEVCAAERVVTTCELLPYEPEGDCGCVEGQCIWNQLDCGGPAPCTPIRPGEFGLCRMVMGWGVSATTGACEVISGCGCGTDATCGGRVFPTERECRRACIPSLCNANGDADGDGICNTTDNTCNSDGSELRCRRVAPPCGRGTVPEVRDNCYTDRCVTWEECARLSAD